jgi:hypothetical protein
MTGEFAGIEEKLKRAHESIDNLNGEITAFFDSSEYPIRGDEDLEVMFDKCFAQGEREVPIRFPVIAGEIIHHFRSSLDHLAWLFALPDVRETKTASITFPILHDRFNKDGTPSIKGKVEIFARSTVQQMIRDIQPYEGIDHNPDTDMLWIIHDLDRKAKHRELPLIFTAFTTGSELLNRIANLYGNEDVEIPDWVKIQMKKDIKISPLIAFREFSKGNSQPIIPALTQLENEVRRVIDLFKPQL